MKKFFYKSSVLALFAGVLLTGCDPEIDAAEPSKGEADFTTYVALGNSLTAGFQDGALYREGQESSYPAILAQQFALVGGGAFKQPLMAAGVSAGSPSLTTTGFQIPQRPVLRPVEDCKKVTSLSPVPLGPPATDFSVFAPPAEQGPYNNLGVPGAKSFHLLAPGYGNMAGVPAGTANPFFARFASSANTSVVADAMTQNPTFFTLWIGNNDVLSYALAGGVGDMPTDKDQFRAYIQAILTQMTVNGAKGAVGNIPDVSKIPFFTTIPYNGLILTAAEAQGLTAGYAQMGLSHITFQQGANPFVVMEDGVPRKMKATELILLPASNGLKCQGWGSQTPLEDKYVISEEELATIVEYTNSYNATLKEEAANRKLAFADFNAYMHRLAGGFVLNGVNYNSALVTGNAFSLDGIHFTPRGAALVANEFIREINKAYKSNIPTVDETQYRAVVFP